MWFTISFISIVSNKCCCEIKLECFFTSLIVESPKEAHTHTHTHTPTHYTQTGCWISNQKHRKFDHVVHVTGGEPREIAWSWATLDLWVLLALHEAHAWVIFSVCMGSMGNPFVGLQGQFHGTLTWPAGLHAPHS